MPRTRNPYPAEFREQLIGLVRAGRSVESLAREYEPCAATIHDWVKQAGADDGERDDRLNERRVGRASPFTPRGEAAPPRTRYLIKGRGLVRTKRRDIAEVFEFMTANPLRVSRCKASARAGPSFAIKTMSAVLNVSRSGFYAYGADRRAQSARQPMPTLNAVRAHRRHSRRHRSEHMARRGYTR